MRKILLLLMFVFIVTANDLPAAGSNDPAVSLQSERHVIKRLRHNMGYTKDNFTVFYRGQEVKGAMASSFIDLGGGYGKDTWSVFYEGREMKDARSSSFQNLGEGYGKDTWTVFYEGKEMKDARSSSFQNLGEGYGKDTWTVFYMGNELKGASASSFQVPDRPKHTPPRSGGSR